MQRIQTTGLFKTLLTGPAGILNMVTLMLLAGLLTVPWAQAPDPDLNNDGTVTGKDISAEVNPQENGRLSRLWM